MTRTRCLVVFVLLLAAGCSGKTDPSVAASRSDAPRPEVRAAQARQLAEANQRIAELEAEKQRLEAEKQQRLKAEKQRQARAKAEARRQQQEKQQQAQEIVEELRQERAEEIERKRTKELQNLVGAMSKELIQRWQKLSRGGASTPQDKQWMKAMETVAEKLAAKTPLDEADLKVLKYVGLAWWGTKDGPVFHRRLAYELTPNERRLILLLLEEHAPSLGLDREHTASLGLWLTGERGNSLFDQCSRLRTVASVLAEGRPLEEPTLERIRAIPALKETVARYEQAISDPKQRAAMYAKEAEAWEVALKETQGIIDTARKAVDTDTAALNEVQDKIEPLTKYKRLTERSQRLLDDLKRQAAVLQARIKENRETVDSLQAQLEYRQQLVAMYREKAKGG